MGLTILFLKRMFEPPPSTKGSSSENLFRNFNTSPSEEALLKLLEKTSNPKELYGFRETLLFSKN